MKLINNDQHEKRDDYIHISFEIGLLLKGIDGLLEIIGGALLLVLSPGRLNSLISILTQHELSEDPKDRIANLLIALGHNFSISTQHFGVFYLVSHGIIKCVLVTLLRHKKLWAYPLSIITFILFCIYQIYRYTINHSIFLIFFTILDIILIVLSYMEYKKIKINLNRND